MKNQVGKIKAIKLNEETQELEVTVVISDPKFKKKLLRDLSLSGFLCFQNNELIYTPEM